MSADKRRGKLFYHRLLDFARKDEKLDFLSDNALNTVDWQRLTPNTKHTWLRSDTEDEFDSFIPIGSRETSESCVFSDHSIGVQTSRDAYVYGFEKDALLHRTKRFVDNYNAQVDKYKHQTPKPDVDDFVDYETIDWSSTLKRKLVGGQYADFDRSYMRDSLYRPYAKRYLYYSDMLVHRPGHFRLYFPNEYAESENRVIFHSGMSSEKPFMALVVDCIPDLNVTSPGTGGAKCFPFYTYDEDGGNRRENITDYALDQFRRHYSDTRISKWDIFYYVYGILHHPGYRERYALDLKRNLPRIPFAPSPANDAVGATHRVARDCQPGGFWTFSQAGAQLADLHLNYESADRYPLDWQSTRKPVSYRVEKMLPKGKVDSSEGNYKVYSTLKYNDTLTLHGIPERAFAYRLGNRSALDWIVDQYRVKTDRRSGITHDPNGYSDDEQYILKLIERVISVSLRTVDIVEELARLPFRPESTD